MDKYYTRKPQTMYLANDLMKAHSLYVPVMIRSTKYFCLRGSPNELAMAIVCWMRLLYVVLKRSHN